MRPSQILPYLLLLGTQNLVQSQGTSSKPCPLFGPDYDPPRNLAQDSQILQAKSNFTETVLRALNNSATGGLDKATSFSLEVYSLVDEQPIFTYHFSSPELSKAPSGVKQVDSNTIYRIGSVSKLLTMYVYLINSGFAGWQDPITKYIPELATFAQNHSSSSEAINVPDYNRITLGALASHLGGLPRDAATGPAVDAQLAAAGLPKVPPAPGNYCGDPAVQQFPCTREDFFANYLSEHPVALPFRTPIYANAPFYLIQLALEKATSKSLSTLFNASMVSPLKLNGTYFDAPPTNVSGVIPGNMTEAWWGVNLFYDVAAGGYYSTLNDLRSIGRSILSSSLVPPQVLGQWLKPTTFTADPNQLVGAPWEIMRAPIPRTSYMYTKSGDVTGYSAIMALLPDYNVGFNILTAGGSATSQSRILSDMLSNIFVPAVEAAAKAQATQNFAGTYTDSSTNSSMTIAVTPSDHGLVVQSWTVGGQDVLAVLTTFLASDPTKQKATIHLYPSGLSTGTLNGTNSTESWRAVFEVFPQTDAIGVFTSPCQTWNGVDKIVYGGVGFDEFVFDVSGGKAISVEARVLRLVMPKVQGTKMARRTFQA